MDTAQKSTPDVPARTADAFRTIADIAENRLSEEDGLRLIDALEAVTDEYLGLCAEAIGLLERHLSCTRGKSVST